MDRSGHYERMARGLEQNARRSSGDVREAYLKLAAGWRRLAREARDGAMRGR